jgi:hypothetical protein
MLSLVYEVMQPSRKGTSSCYFDSDRSRAPHDVRNERLGCQTSICTSKNLLWITRPHDQPSLATAYNVSQSTCRRKSTLHLL